MSSSPISKMSCLSASSPVMRDDGPPHGPQPTTAKAGGKILSHPLLSYLIRSYLAEDSITPPQGGVTAFPILSYLILFY